MTSLHHVEYRDSRTDEGFSSVRKPLDQRISCSFPLFCSPYGLLTQLYTTFQLHNFYKTAQDTVGAER